MRHKCFKKGQSLIELLVAIGIAAILLPALLTGLVASREGKAQQQQRFLATNMLKETQEALRTIRETGWTTFANNGTFHVEASGSQWILSPNAQTINGITQQIQITDVHRDGVTGAIENNPGAGDIVDPSTKRAVITISWNTPQANSISSTLFLTRYLDNLTFTQSNVGDFNPGTRISTTITNTGGGEIILGAGGGADWCAPSLTTATVDLPKNGVANSIAAIEGRVFTGTGENASGVSYATVAVNDTPSGTKIGEFDGYKTNGVFGDSNYAYITTDTNNQELVIINLNSVTNGKYNRAGSFASPNGSNGNSVYVVGNTAYFTAGTRLYSVNVTNKNSPTLLAQAPLAGTGNKVVVKNNFVFVATSGLTHLQIFESINNGQSLVLRGSLLNVNISSSAIDVYVNDTADRAYLVTASSPLLREFFIINTSVKALPLVIGSFETNGMSPKGVTVVPGNIAIVVGTGGKEYQVISIQNETNPTSCGNGLEVDAGINGIASVRTSANRAYSYIITGDSTSELKIIEGGPGGSFATSGTFESATFDSSFTTAFNRFAVNFSEPTNTNIRFQVAVADPINGNCNNVIYTFVGPSGTSSDFFETNGSIPFQDDGSGYENPGRCFRYKVYFDTTDVNATAVFTDITVNYSP